MSYTIKAEPTKEYFQRITKLMDIQEQTFGLKRSLASDVMSGTNPNGYVKVCGSWLKRMWGVTGGASKGISDVTTIFDSCGAYDFKNSNPVSKGSKYDDWKDALTFLEWYGIPHMDNFGIIVIDNENPSKYIQVTGSDSVTEECFNKAALLSLQLASAIAAMLYMIN